jgi:hypothetical protein
MHGKLRLVPIIMRSFNVLLLVLAMACAGIVRANNTCSAPTILTVNTTCVNTALNFSGSTISGTAPTCATSASQDLWCTFVANDSTISIQLGATAGLNHGFEIIADSCNGTSIVCINSNSTGSSEFYIGNDFGIGRTYYLRVFNVSSAVSTATTTICVRNYPMPANNYCANAITLTPNLTCVNTAGVIAGSTLNSVAPVCGSTSLQDVWYKFIALDSTNSISVVPSGTEDFGFEIITDSCNGASLLCINNNFSGTSEFYIGNTFGVGRTYYVRVFTRGGISTGSFDICIRRYPMPNNNYCANANVLLPNASCIYATGTTAGATGVPPVSGCAASSIQDVWYTFVATDPTMSINLLPGGADDLGFQLFTDSCNGPALPFGCINANFSGTSEYFISNTLTAGRTYYVRVFSVSGIAVGTFSICLRNYPTPSNDSCSGALMLQTNSACVYTNISLQGSTLSTAVPSCASATNQDVWCSFIATDVNMTITLQASSGLNHGFEVFNGSCTGSSILCRNINGNGSSESASLTGLSIGTTYYIRVINNGSSLNSSAFGICVFGTVVSCVPSIAIGTANSNICSGNLTTFTSSITNGGSSPSYQWKVNGALVASTANYSSSSLANGDIVTCSLISNATCASTSTVTSTPIVITVSPNVTPAINISSPNNGACAGLSISCLSSTTNSGANPTYQWFANGTAVTSIGNAPNYIATLSNGSTVYCVLTSAAACASPAQDTSNTIVISTVTSSAPTINISASSNNICVGSTVTFNAIVTNGGSAPTYQWYKNGLIAATGAAYTTNSLANSDAISCILTSNSPCATIVSATSNVITMNVSATSPATISINSTNNNACAGSSIAFTSTISNGGNVPSFAWYVNNNLVSSSSSFASTTLNNSDQVYCVLTSNSACAVPNVDTSNYISAIVSALVTPSVSISTGSTNYCAGNNISITSLASHTGSSPQYNWYVNGVLHSTTSSPNFSSTTLPAGTLTINCVLVSNQNCVTSATAISNNIVVLNANPLTPTISITSSAASICAGATVNFSSLVTNAGTSPTYQWRVNGTVLGAGASFATSSLTNGDVIDCILTSSANCVTSSTAFSNSIAINVISAVQPTISISTSNTTLCSGTSATFTSSIVNAGSSPSYQWFVNGLSSGVSSTYASSALNNGDVIQCVLASSLQCASPASDTSNAITVTVNNAVLPTISISASANNYCSGDTIKASASGTNVGLAPSYSWYVNGNLLGSGPQFESATLPTGTLSIYCQLTSNAVCAQPQMVNSNTLTITNNALVQPAISISTSTQSICQGQQVQFVSTDTNAGLTPIYQWMVNGINVGTSTNTFNTSVINDNDTIVCQLTSNAQCISSISVLSNQIIMNVDSITLPTFTPLLPICEGDTLVLPSSSLEGIQGAWSPVPNSTISATYTFNPMSGQCAQSTTLASVVLAAPSVAIAFNANMLNATIGFSKYQWLLNGTIIPQQTSSSLSPNTNGAYLVIATDSNGCSATTSFDLNNLSSTTMDFDAFSIVPNPAQNYISISSKEVSNKLRNVEIYTAEGKLVLSAKLVSQKDHIDIGNLAAGIYFVKFDADSHRQKFIKQ